MNRQTTNMQRLLALSLLTLITISCAETTGGVRETHSPIVMALGRIVRTTGYDQEDWRRDGLTQAYQRDQIVYDSFFRRPGFGHDATEVECSNIERIAIVFVVDKTQMYAAAQRSALILKFAWHIPSPDGDMSIYEYFKGPAAIYFQGVANEGKPFTAGLRFTKRQPQNGTYTVVVSYREAELYREAFKIFGCD